MVIGGGTNLIVSDAGFRGIVLRYRADSLRAANGARDAPTPARCCRTWSISPMARA